MFYSALAGCELWLCLPLILIVHYHFSSNDSLVVTVLKMKKHETILSNFKNSLPLESLQINNREVCRVNPESNSHSAIHTEFRQKAEELFQMGLSVHISANRWHIFQHLWPCNNFFSQMSVLSFTVWAVWHFFQVYFSSQKPRRWASE